MVSYDVMVSLLGKELDRESSYISDSIRTAFFAAGCTQTKQNGCLLANSIQELGRGKRRNIVCYFKLAPGTSSLSMDNPGTPLQQGSNSKDDYRYRTSQEYARG
jgi:hypothetical protein